MQLWKPRGESGGGGWLPRCGSFKSDSLLRNRETQRPKPNVAVKAGSLSGQDNLLGRSLFLRQRDTDTCFSRTCTSSCGDVTPRVGHKMSLLWRNYACSFIIHEGVPGLRLPGNNNWRVFPASCRSACQIWSSGSSGFLFSAKRSDRHSSTHPATAQPSAGVRQEDNERLIHPEHD